jgi:predicted metalloprotease
MKFNPRARLGRSNIEDVRGTGGGRMPGGLPGGLPTGGGVIGIIIFIVILFLSQRGGDGGTGTDPGQGKALENCQTGADTKNLECRIDFIIESIEGYWARELPRQANTEYQESNTRYLSGQVNTGCGVASSAVGPFYCPADRYVYLDPTFFDQMLEGQLGAQGGDFAEAYVVAHEYGHHVQDLLGTMAQVKTRQGPTSDAVRLELQADCYAGMWAKGATTIKDAQGEVLITEITEQDIKLAIDAAAAVGDDRIQEKSQGRVNPENWTHGSAEQRMNWFMTGFQSGSLEECDTFQTDNL